MSATCPRQSVVPRPYSLSPWGGRGGSYGGKFSTEENLAEQPCSTVCSVEVWVVMVRV